MIPAAARNEVARHGDERLQVGDAQVPSGPAPHGNLARGRLAVSDDEHEGYLLELRIADLVSDLLAAQVGLGPQAGLAKDPDDLLRPGRDAVGDRQNPDLD